jgi:hypothetical protein
MLNIWKSWETVNPECMIKFSIYLESKNAANLWYH